MEYEDIFCLWAQTNFCQYILALIFLKTAVPNYKWAHKSHKRTHVRSSQCNHFSARDGMSVYIGMCCCLQAIRWSFANVGCISSVLSRESNMWTASWGLNIFRSIVEVKFHHPLPLNLVTELQTLKRRKLNSVCHILQRTTH